MTLTETTHPSHQEIQDSMALQRAQNAEDANDTIESHKVVKKLPRALARATSCQDCHQGAAQSDSMGVRAAAAKPTTKCELT